MTVRRQALTAVLAGLTLFAAACGSSSSPSTPALPTLQTMTAKALAYAKCMRAHGVPNYPDPTVVDNGHEKGITFSGSGVDSSSPQARSAAKACRAQTGFGVISPAMMQAAMANGVKFADCMRSHGISNYPDPVEHATNIQIGPGPNSGIDMNSAQFKAAQKACLPILPNGGP